MRIEIRLNGRQISEIESDRAILTIGRAPDSDIFIDNLAVSSRHAQIEKRGLGYRVSDMGSTNGTFVGGERVRAKELADGDMVTIGKHTLVFFTGGGRGGQVGRVVARKASSPEGTMALETPQQRELLEREAVAEMKKNGGKVGILTVLTGSTDRDEYELLSPFVMIGKNPDAVIQLGGLLDPRVAGFVERRGQGYALVPPETGNRLKLNGAAVTARTPLREGDTIEVKGVSMRFGMRS